MKEKIIYIFSFLLAFALITGLLIYLNSAYKNIFAFDFTPANHVPDKIVYPTDSLQTEIQPADTTKINSALVDSLVQKPDSIQAKTTTAALKDSATVKAVAQIQKEIKKTEVAKTIPEKVEPVKENLSQQMIAKRESDYKAWIQTTVKLYESMDTRKAAKIIQGYSDNIARDILFTMKKKKAAEILAEFKPETATRIISIAQ